MTAVTVAIIGSGPAGYTAALYNARARLKPVVFAGEKSGGQLMWTTEVENYPGFPEGKDGPELMLAIRQQAERFGAVIKDKFVTAVDFSSQPFKLWTNLPQNLTSEDLERLAGDELAAVQAQVKQAEPALTAQAVIVATGAVARMLGIPGEKELLGRGVSTCAVCDAAFYKDKVVYVVGGGDSAMEDTLALTKFAKKIYVVHRRDELRASQIMQDRVLAHDQVKVLWNSQVKAVLGENKVEQLEIEQVGENKIVLADGLFLAVGHQPLSAILGGQLETDKQGYIITRQSPTRQGAQAAAQAVGKQDLLPFPTMTSVEGVFAAGDVVDMRYQQAITAAGQGCAAALDAEQWLAQQVT